MLLSIKRLNKHSTSTSSGWATWVSTFSMSFDTRAFKVWLLKETLKDVLTKHRPNSHSPESPAFWIKMLQCVSGKGTHLENMHSTATHKLSWVLSVESLKRCAMRVTASGVTCCATAFGFWRAKRQSAKLDVNNMVAPVPIFQLRSTNLVLFQLSSHPPCFIFHL